MPPWHRSGERVTAEALWQLCEGLARELAWTGRAVCVDSRLGARYVSFVFVGRMGALGCARDHGKQCMAM